MRVERIQNDRFSPPVRNRANAYAAGAPTSTEMVMELTEMIRLSRTPWSPPRPSGGGRIAFR